VTYDLCLKKYPNLRDSQQLPGVFCREVDYEYNNSRIFKKMKNDFWACLLGPGEVV
jgi:hypothetical protein